MQDQFQRQINYLRISVTDRCNLRCLYCMPEDGVELISREEVLRWEEILKIVQSCVKAGIRKVRLTGGEPLIRLGLTAFVRQLGEIPEIDDIALTTNGILLPQYAKELKEAGLKRVNISLDTLRPERFARITRGGSLAKVWAGVEAAVSAGLEPLKFNCVVMRGTNDDELPDFARLTLTRTFHVRFIELMPIGSSDKWAGGSRVTIPEIKEKLAELGPLLPREQVTGGGPAKYYTLPEAKGTIGFISAMSEHFCAACNRLRLTSEGKLRPCLHSKQEVDLRTPLRAGAGVDDLAAIVAQAVARKPKQHSMVDDGWADNERVMSQIGG